jgi:hypothetical protein
MPFLPPLPALTRPPRAPLSCVTVGTLFHSDGDDVPSGTRTDLASIPRALHWLLPPASPYEAAAIRHDDGCNRLNARLPGRDSRTTDRDFRTDLRDLGMGVIRRWMMWLGVRLGALVSPTRRPGIAKDLPAMLALVILNLWVVPRRTACPRYQAG